MAIAPRLRLKLQESLGDEAAEALVKAIEDSESFPGDMAELRHEMQLSFARIDGRFERMEAMLGDKLTAMEKHLEDHFNAALATGLRKQTQFFFLAWSVLLASVVALFAK